MTNIKTEGTVVYSSRAFDQDAQQAIRGNLVRALIELITNADDEYGDREGARIRVLIDKPQDPSRFVADVSVLDTATGLTAEGLQECFTVLGAKTAHFHDGGASRGMLGRGAKDVASLGAITFSAVKDGKYSSLTLNRDGKYKFTAQDEPATDEVRSHLGLAKDQNGLRATIHVANGVKVPAIGALQKELGATAQLRDVSRRREIAVEDRRGAKPKVGAVTPLEVRGDVLVDTDLEVKGYDKPVHLTLRRLPERSTSRLSETSEHGILIATSNAIYENTLFAATGRPESGWLAGRLTAPELEDLIRGFDDGAITEKNPSRLLERDRDGLQKEHPYYRALQVAVMAVLDPILNDLATEEGGSRKQGDKLSRAFQTAREAIRTELGEIIKEIDEDPSIVGPGPGTPGPLQVIPGRLLIGPGETRTLTVRLTGETEPAAAVEVVVRGDAVAVGTPSAWSEHLRLPAWTCTLTVTGGGKEGESTVEARVGGVTAEGTVIVVDRPDKPLPEPPTTLEFEHAKASVAPQRARNLLLRAPLESGVFDVEIAAIGVPVGHPTLVQMHPEKDGRWLQSVVRVEARKATGEVEMIAAVSDGLKASCKVTVKEPTAGGGPDIDFELVDRDGLERASLMPEAGGLLKVTVYGRHPAVRPVVGKHKEKPTPRFDHEDSPQGRVLLSEILSSELAQYFITREYVRRPDQLNDPDRIFARVEELRDRLSRILLRSLLDG
jgi:hypothetical protein